LHKTLPSKMNFITLVIFLQIFHKMNIKETERIGEKERILTKSNHYNENKKSKLRVYTSRK